METTERIRIDAPHVDVRPQVLIRRKSELAFESDAPAVLWNFLRAQGWTEASFGGRDWHVHLIAEHLDGGQVNVYKSGIVLPLGDRVIAFLDSLVHWCGGDWS